mgnify:CR=1 FL=1
MEWLVIYLFVMIESIKDLFAGGWVLFWGGILTSLLFHGMALSIYCAETMAKYSDIVKCKPVVGITKVLKWSVILGFVFGCVSYLIPDQKSMAIIAGTGITYKAVTSEAGQRIGGKAVSLLEQKIDAALSSEPEVKEAKVKGGK